MKGLWWWRLNIFWNRCVHPFYKVRYIVSWLPLLWNDRNWDWTFLFSILEFKLRKMEKLLRGGHHLYRERDADQVLECAILCKRMGGNYDWYNIHRRKYFAPALPVWSINGEFNGCKYEDYMFSQDLERFTLLLKKYVRNWWD